MLQFCPRRRSEDMTPVVRDVEITKYAQTVLRDYMPERLESPGRIDAYKFAEQYLGANIEVMNIYTDSRDDFIAGAAVFNTQRVKVFDKESMTTAEIQVQPNTIIIDEQVTGHTKNGFEKFTVFHEAGHLMLHREVYQNQAERSLESRPQSTNTKANAALCKRSNMGNSGRLITSLDFREHQANTFAASMLMPPKTFIPYVHHLIDALKYIDGDYVVYEQGKTDCIRAMVYNKIVRETAYKFGASEDAVKVQMTKYGLHANADDDSIYEAKRRLKLYYSLWSYRR